MLKISIVTPSFNQAQYIEQTIDSVLSQNYPNLEYIIIDGGSTDGTLDVIKKYEKHLQYWISEPDNGMYDAISKGFRQTTGDIMGWINADDLLIDGSLSLLNELFSTFPEINWVQGRSTIIDDQSRIVRVGDKRKWSKYDFCLGYYEWIMQEATFWSRELWDKAGRIDPSKKFAGDFDLWCRFFQYEPLYTTDVLLGAHRGHSETQKSAAHFDEYMQEVAVSLHGLRSFVSSDVRWKRIRRLNRLGHKLTRMGLEDTWLHSFIYSKLNRLKDYPLNLRYLAKKKKFVKAHD